MAGQRRYRASYFASKRRHCITTAARKRQFESDWEKEFSPGHRLAKRSELEFEHIHSSSSNSSAVSGSFDVAEDDYEFNGNQAPADESVLHRMFGRHWEELPAKYKLVFATSMAFVLCNMVRTLYLLPQL